MKMIMLSILIALSAVAGCLTDSSLYADVLDDYTYTGSVATIENAITSKIQFNGYTNYWHDIYRQWVRYGNLFKIGIPDVESTIAQSKADIARELGLPGLTMQEGFLNGLLTEPLIMLDQPSFQKLSESLNLGNVLLLVDTASKMGKKLSAKLPENNNINKKLKNQCYRSGEVVEINCYYLENGNKKLYVISSPSKKMRERIRQLIEKTKTLLKEYDLHRGWFGVETNLKSVTCMHGHPLEVIGRGMREGNTWFTFSGYNDFMMKDELSAWLARVKEPVVADVGVNVGVGVESLYGCKDYDGLQVQDMGSKEAWIKFARQKGGYVFRPVYDPASDSYHYDGYIIKNTVSGANDGNKEQIDNENVPFVYVTGSLQNDAVPCMVLFIKKGETLNREFMWEAILERRAVAVLGQGKMIGPEYFRNVLQMLLLDRIFLEEYFGDRIDIQAVMENNDLIVTLTNTYNHSLSGTLKITLPPELKLDGELSSHVILPPQSTKELRFKILPQLAAMNRTNPIAVHYEWGSQRKSTLTMLDMPPVISVHKLLYGHAPRITYPVTIHNFTRTLSFPVHVQVFPENNSDKAIYEATQNCSVNTCAFKNLLFELEMPPGNYNVKVSALGFESTTQLGVGKAEGAPFVYAIDLNGDGINEYRMENDSVRITLLAIGARVIEYVIKDRQENIFFKLWPRKPVDDRRPFRKRGYYPYGGFEDFLGQASIETHKVYQTEIVKKQGDYVRVRMVANYYGNKLEKVFTLYGNSPLLEIRFALTFKNPELNMLGPQPILELGKVHGPEDVFTVPTLKGLQEFRMRPKEYWGRILHLKEGWNAGYDSKEDITFVGAFPVTQPLFLHMWMNHPKNPGSHYYYAEFQPWVPIFQKSTMYFSYYIWGSAGFWKDGLNALKRRNLITSR